MKVREIMTRDVKACRPETSLAGVAATMWSADCGFVPVLDSTHKVVGVLTDRDICIAAGTRARPASELFASDVMATKVFSCPPDVDIRVALKAMADHRVRRLPVAGPDGLLQGVISLNDIALRAQSARPGKAPPEITFDTVMHSLKAIFRRPGRTKKARERERTGVGE